MAKKEIQRLLKYRIWNLLSLLLAMWIVEIHDQIRPEASLDRYGIVPEKLHGLFGILTAPFLHVGLIHLVSNTFPLLILGLLILYHSVEEFWIATFMSTLVGGFGAWAFGQPKSIHIGASILVFGYMGFLLLRGFLNRSNVARYIAAGVLYFYGANLIYGVLPTAAGISWEGHLFGCIGGLLAAHVVSKT